MPTHTHEALAQLLCDAPELVPELLRRCLGLTPPPHASVERLGSNRSQAMPTEHRADGTFVLRDAAGGAVAAYVVEVQLRPDEDKRWRWPAYLAQVCDRFRFSTEVFILANDAATAQWASASATAGAANIQHSLVLGPKPIPRLTSAREAQTWPELTVVSALAHAPDTDAQTFLAITQGLAESRLQQGRLAYYVDLIRASLSEAARASLEAEMIPPDYVPQSSFSKNIMAAIAEGKAVGKVEGEAAGLRRALHTFISPRRLSLSPAQQARIDGCDDAELLTRWIAQAATTSSARGIFEAES